MTTPGARSPSLVALRGVSKTYDNGTRALEGVDLDIREGEFLTLVGPSGCGKSTLLRLVANLSRPSAGSVSWWGESADAMIAQAGRIAFVFQSPTLMPWASVATNVRLPLDLAGVSRVQSTRAVEQALARVGLGNAARHLPRQLSGGMQMRASIARALVTEPSLLLMDEPFGAIDEFTRQRLDIDLLDLWLAQRFTVVFVTHSIQEAVFLSTRVVAMAAHPGRIVESFAVEEAYPRSASFRMSPSFATIAHAVSTAVAKASADALPDVAGDVAPSRRQQ